VVFLIDEGLLGAATTTGDSYFSYCYSSFLSFLADEDKTEGVTYGSSFIFWSFGVY